MGKKASHEQDQAQAEEKAVKLPFEATIKASEKEYVVEVREDGLKLVRWIKR
jgi:hypothetical protein